MAQMTKNPYDLKLKLICKENVDRLNDYHKNGTCFPIEMEVSPTNICNLKCKWCISEQYHKNDMLERDILLKFLREYKEMGGKSIIWSGGGEPTTYPHFIEAIKELDKLGIDQGLMTNGFFNDKILNVVGNIMKWTRISLDTVNKDRYKNLKGVDAFDTVLENIKKLSKYPTKLVINMNISKENEDEIFEVAWKVKQLGAQGFQLRPVLPCPAEPKLYIPPNIESNIKSLKNIQTKDFFVSISYDKFEEMTNPRRYNSCKYHHFICVLNANGELSVCMYRLYEPDFVFGNINKNSLKDIWNSEQRKKVIEKTINMDFSKCQVCCKGHELNDFLHDLDVANSLGDKKFL